MKYIVAIVLLGFAGFVGFIAKAILVNLVLREPAVEAIRNVRPSYGPDISHCFAPEEARDLWDCIRHEE